MADEEDPWGAGDEETVTTGAASTADAAVGGATADAVTASGGEQSAGEGVVAEGVAEEEQAPPPPPPEDDGYRKPVQLYRHWVRPKFLQYKYMYNYRTNYYDDVIDYLDKRQIGVNRDIPRPQVWAERVLRTNTASTKTYDRLSSVHKQDSRLIITLPATIRTHNYHTKAYINQKYAHVL